MNGLIMGAVALAMASSLPAQTVTQGKAKVIRIKGYARFTAGNNVWQPLKVGEVLRPGTVIQTGIDKGSFVDLVLGDGEATVASGSVPSTSATPVANNNNNNSKAYQPSAEQNVVRVWENSLLGIDKLTSMETGADVVTETQLNLQAGRIFGSVKKMSAASKYEVKIPNGVAGIRGTVFEITAEGVIKVASGVVVLAFVGADGNVTTQEVAAGQEFDARTLKISPLPPAEVQRLLALPRGVIVSEAPPLIKIKDQTLYRDSKVSPTEGQ
jgi:hypothetical protein